MRLTWEDLKVLRSATSTTSITFKLDPIHPNEQPREITHKVVVVEPLRGRHQQSFILLHGSGDDGTNFGPMLLATSMGLDLPWERHIMPDELDMTSLRHVFPHARFLFPTALERPMARFEMEPCRRWFDWWSLNDDFLSDRSELQRQGLRETVGLVHEMIRREADLLKDDGGFGNVVLGGLSNGCGGSLASLLLWPGEPLGAYLGMCGWLPYAEQIAKIAGVELRGVGGDKVQKNDEDDNDDSKEAKTKILEETAPQRTAAKTWLTQEITRLPTGNNDDEEDHQKPLPIPTVSVASTKDSSPPPSSSTASIPSSNNGLTPVFLGHGTEDHVVPEERSDDAAAVLRALGYDVRLEKYEGLGHWYSAAMLRDVVSWVEDLDEWQGGELMGWGGQ